MSRFHNALYLGDAAERVAVLESTSQVHTLYCIRTTTSASTASDTLCSASGVAAATCSCDRMLSLLLSLLLLVCCSHVDLHMCIMVCVRRPHWRALACSDCLDNCC
jgi:hypothetical protein